jgi:hypothetical protein
MAAHPKHDRARDVHPLAAASQSYAENGWPVFPCEPSDLPPLFVPVPMLEQH